MANIADLSIVKKFHRGKVRDIYDLGDTLLLVTSDRVSAFDVVFNEQIPNKGKILNSISKFFFEQTGHLVKNHFITDDPTKYPAELLPFAEQLRNRSMLVKKTRVIPFECIVRGYITGSGWADYKKTGLLAGQKPEIELVESQKLPNPMFTPSTKAEEGHDENISYKQMLERMDTPLAETIKNISIALYTYAHDYLWDRGIVLADTKFEFGTLAGEVYLIDEALTPDSSRYWDKSEYAPGGPVKSYDKQFVRDWAAATGWDKTPPAPAIPDEVINNTLAKYMQAYKAVTQQEAAW